MRRKCVGAHKAFKRAALIECGLVGLLCGCLSTRTARHTAFTAPTVKLSVTTQKTSLTFAKPTHEVFKFYVFQIWFLILSFVYRIWDLRMIQARPLYRDTSTGVERSLITECLLAQRSASDWTKLHLLRCWGWRDPSPPSRITPQCGKVCSRALVVIAWRVAYTRYLGPLLGFNEVMFAVR